MTTIEIENGRDAWVNEAKPNAKRGDSNQVRPLDGPGQLRRGFVRPPINRQILGRTVLSATLYGHVRGATIAQTLTWRRVSEPTGAFRNLDWEGRPDTVGPGAHTTIGALAGGDEVAWDITELVQPVAAGAPWYGLELRTDDTVEGARFHSYDSGNPSWRVVIVLSDELDQPTELTPDGGSVSSGAPILSWPAPDLGGTTDQAAFQVQVDPGMDEVTPDFDATVVSVDPQYNLATDGVTAGFVALASAASTFWRVRVQSQAGVWSEWSDWADFTHTPKPVLTITEPATGSIYDPTPPVEGSIDTGTLESFRVFVTHGTDRTRIRYDSGRVDASGLSFGTIVEEFFRGRRVFRDDTSYQIGVRIWDAVDRADGVVGDPTYVSAWTTVTFDDDLAVAPVTSYDVTTDGSPLLTHTWVDPTEPDNVYLRRNGRIYARLGPDEWTRDGTTYSWTDHGHAPGYEESAFNIRRIVANRASSPVGDTITPTPTGVWLLAGDDTVVLSGTGVSGFRTNDRRATYSPVNVDHLVDIHYGTEGVTGSYEGWIHDAVDQDMEAARGALERIKADYISWPVRLVWVSESRWVILRNLTVLPDDEFLPGQRRHRVSFDFYESPVPV